MASFVSTWSLLGNAESQQPYLLIDAAGLEGGAAAIPREAFSELECLFTGDLAEELADVAPWLGRLKSWGDSEAAVVEQLMNEQAATVAVLDPRAGATLAFAEVHRHFRKFNVVYAPDDRAVFFRYYDPRVLPSVLKVLDPEQLRAFFGPVRLFLASPGGPGVTQASMLRGALHLQH